MTKDRKIELQEKIIHRLEEEKKSLLEENKELKKRVNDNQKIIEAANKYQSEHEKMMAELVNLKKAYLKAIEDISIYKKEYTKEMKGLLKTVKKNI
jgi:hypothetical protein